MSEDEALGIFEQNLGTELPAGVEVVEIHAERGVGDAAFVDLEMPAGTWDVLIESAGLEGPDESPQAAQGVVSQVEAVGFGPVPIGDGRGVYEGEAPGRWARLLVIPGDDGSVRVVGGAFST